MDSYICLSSSGGGFTYLLHGEILSTSSPLSVLTNNLIISAHYNPYYITVILHMFID